MRLDSSLRWNDEDSTPVIPGEQRETRNSGAYNRGKGVLFLSSCSWQEKRKAGNLTLRLTDYGKNCPRNWVGTTPERTVTSC